jgi:hypothetical protein
MSNPPPKKKLLSQNPFLNQNPTAIKNRLFSHRDLKKKTIFSNYNFCLNSSEAMYLYAVLKCHPPCPVQLQYIVVLYVIIRSCSDRIFIFIVISPQSMYVLFNLFCFEVLQCLFEKSHSSFDQANLSLYSILPIGSFVLPLF